MLALVAIWAFAEALLLFIVADVPISAVGLRYGAKRPLLAALLAAICAALGGLAMLHWAASDPAGSRAAILSLPGITPALFDSASADWHAHGFLAMTMGAFEGVPYKIYAHAAGLSGAGTGWTGTAIFLLASIAARLPRFAVIALTFGAMRKPLRRLLPQWAIWALFGAGWAVFYAWYFAAMAA